MSREAERKSARNVRRSDAPCSRRLRSSTGTILGISDSFPGAFRALLDIFARKTQPIEHAGTFSRPKPPSTRASLIDFRWPGKKRSALRCGRDEQFFHSQGQADDDRDQTGNTGVAKKPRCVPPARRFRRQPSLHSAIQMTKYRVPRLNLAITAWQFPHHPSNTTKTNIK